MANTLLLKRRIKTAQNVSKTTRAMQMIATSKLRTAQTAAMESRPYIKSLTETMQDLASRIQPEKLPYYMQNINEPKKTLLIIFSPDKGLCAGLNTNLVREAENFINVNEVFLLTVGKKIENYIARSNRDLIASFKFGTTSPTLNMIYPIVQIIDEYFMQKKVGKVKLLFTYFSSIFIQQPKIIDILPIAYEAQEESRIPDTMLFEPDLETILKGLTKRYVENILYQGLLESFLCEQAARMIAMQNATNNAKDIIYDLTLEYNKARQEKITNEILDISSASMITI